MPRKRHVSRNWRIKRVWDISPVMPRKRHVSRNCNQWLHHLCWMVMPRKRHVSRNFDYASSTTVSFASCLARGMWVETWKSGGFRGIWMSCLARGMWVETKDLAQHIANKCVMPRKRHVSRNFVPGHNRQDMTSCLARGMWVETTKIMYDVRKGGSHASQEACE